MDHSSWLSTFRRASTVVALALWVATAATGAQEIEGLSTTWIGGLAPGETGRLAVRWSGEAGAELTVWVDFDGDGVFDDTTERVVEGASIGVGIEVFELQIPDRVVIDGRTRMRIRVRPAGEMSGREVVMTVLEKKASECEWASGFAGRGLDNLVLAMALHDDGSGPALYVGGAFVAIGSQIVNYIAKWDGATWSPLGTGMNGWVLALTVYDDGSGPALYVGGTFFTAGGVNANGIARWDGARWKPLDTGISGYVIGGTVSALTVYDDGSGPALYAGGSFPTAGGVSASNVAKWDGAAWTPLGTGMNNYVAALTVYDDGSGPALYVGGNFTTAGGVSASRIAKWDGAAWTPLGTGMDDEVRALTVYDDGKGSVLFAGGGSPLQAG